MKNVLLSTALLLLLSLHSRAQQAVVTLSDCYAGLETNYPGYRQYQLNDDQYALQAKNLQANFLPQVEWNAQATWQSAVSSLPLDLSFAGLNIPGVSKDQYKTTLDIRQLIWDAGTTRRQKTALDLENSVEQTKTTVALYQLKAVVQQAFFQVLLSRENIRLNQLMQENLTAALKKALDAQKNGLGSKEQVNTLKAAELQTRAAQIQLQNGWRNSLLQLEKLTGLPIDTTTMLEIPQTTTPEADILRPELDLFALQKQWISQKQEVLRAANAPKVSVFATLGYGRPGLNFLSNDFETFALTGIAFRWNLGTKFNGKERRDLQLLAIQQKQIGLSSENFLLQTDIQSRQLFNKLEELEAIRQLEAEQLALHDELLQLNEARLALGTTTASDYLRFLNETNESRIRLAINHIQQLFTKEQIKYITGQP